MAKISKAEAASKALDELSGKGSEAEDTEEYSGEEEDSEVSASGSDDEGSEEESEESADESGDEEESSEAGDEPESDDESVQSVADAAVRRAFERSVAKRGRQDEGESKEGYTGLRDRLLNDIKSELAGDKKGPLDIDKVDTKDPASVQKYVDSRIEHAVNAAMEPLIRQTAEREANLELAHFAKTHPDGWKYGKQIAGLIKDNPKLTLEQAYTLASKNDGIRKGKKEAFLAMKKKKNANLATNTARGKSEAGSSKPVKSARQAVLAALEETGATFGDA